MKPQLILDANAFINHVDLHKLHDRFDFLSSAGALSEVRDQHARERLEQLPYAIKTKSASESSLKFTKVFA